MGMVQLGCWLVGEFGEMLIDGQAKGPDGEPVTVSEEEIIEVYELVLDEHDRRGQRSDVIISWALTALSKLTIRLKNSQTKVKDIIETYTDHANVEIQQRACEYLEIFKDQWDNDRTGIFEPIPFKGDENMLVDTANRAVKDDDDESASTPATFASAGNEFTQQESKPTPVAQVADTAPPVNLLDDIFGGPSVPMNPAPVDPIGGTGLMTDLSDVFGGGPTQPVSTQPTAAPAF
jgi:AP-1 complex subunit gamma-1